MKCLRCGSSNTKVLDSRLIEDNTKIRRRRECNDCKFRFTTFEVYEKEPLYVVKSSGKREEYSREKLVKSLKLCFAKRIEDVAIIDDIVSDFEKTIENQKISEIKTDTISQMIMEKLKVADPVSCVIYACNTCGIQSIAELEDLILYIKN